MEKIEKSLKMSTTTVAETIAENPKKTPRMEVQVGYSSSSSRESSLKDLFEEILQEHDEEHGADSQYWAVNQVRFVTLAATAAKFLCAPGTSPRSFATVGQFTSFSWASRQLLGKAVRKSRPASRSISLDCHNHAGEKAIEDRAGPLGSPGDVCQATEL
ncbi:unnamed protein product [Leuciscus chuanchicus]